MLVKTKNIGDGNIHTSNIPEPKGTTMASLKHDMSTKNVHGRNFSLLFLWKTFYKRICYFYGICEQLMYIIINATLQSTGKEIHHQNMIITHTLPLVKDLTSTWQTNHTEPQWRN